MDVRLVGSVDAGIHEYPWVVFVEITINYQVKFCGGAIISDLWVASAAHCKRELVYTHLL